MADDLRTFAANVPLFQGLNSEDYATVCMAMVQRRFSAGETILYEEDDETQTFFIIATGRVNVVVLTSEGKQTILATLRPGDFFGEMAILDGEPRSASVVAAEECELYMLYRRQFLEILNTYPKITVQLLVAMSRRLRRSNRQINTLSLMSVYGRVADVLLRLAKEQGKRVDDMIVISSPPTHQTLAEMVGTSRETVSRILSQLKKKHCISADRKKLVILNEEKLYD